MTADDEVEPVRPFFDHAGELFALGWKPIRLPAAGKYPPTSGTTGEDGVDLSRADVEALREEPGAWNVGTRAPVGVLGIDVDDYDDKTGGATITALEVELGEALPDTYRSSARPAPSGIYWFRVPEGYRTISGLPGVDAIQRHHRYGTLPPSIHPELGKPYGWTNPDGDPCDAPSVDDLVELPLVWRERLKASESSRAASEGRGDGDELLERLRGAGRSERVSTTLEAALVELGSGVGRYDSVVRSTMRLVRLGEQGELGVVEALASLRQAYVHAVADTRDAVTARREYDRAVSDAADKIAGDPSVVDPHDWPGPRQAAPVVEVVEQRNVPVDWHELWKMVAGEEWLLEPLIPAGRLVALYSKPKIGKSLLALELAARIATGGTILGSPCRRARVLYLDFENDLLGDVRERLEAMGFQPEDLDDLRLISFPSLEALDTKAGALELMEIVERELVELVVIDTVSRAVAGPENENDTWLAFYRATGIALKRAGVACLRLDHAGKIDSAGMRGGSAKYGDVDAVWKLTQIGNSESSLELTCEATRFTLAEGLKRISVRRLREPTRHEADSTSWGAFERAISEAIVEADRLELPKDLGRRALAKRLGIPERVARRVVERRGGGLWDVQKAGTE